MSRMLALKTDAGSGALEQMVLAEYCAPHFTDACAGAAARPAREARHADGSARTSSSAPRPNSTTRKGGIFLWVKLPDNVDTMKLYQAALAAGVAINPGTGMVDRQAYSRSRMRLCFASPTHEEIREGIAVLAEVCRKEFGVPARSANVAGPARS